MAPGLVAVVGPNGAGKTSLLEAVAVLGTLGSFRTTAPQTFVRHGADGFLLEGDVERGTTLVRLRVEARGGARLTRTLFRGARRLSPGEYLELFPVVVLSRSDRDLIWGGPDERRRFLDRVAFYLRRDMLPDLQRYRRALRQRNALLGPTAADAELDAFERDLARYGARIVAGRLAAVAALETHLYRELSDLGWSPPRPILRYHSGEELASGDANEIAARLRSALSRSRRAERIRGHTLVGPHRHDLVLTVGGAPARDVLSAGQGKLLATGLKLAAMAVLVGVRGSAPTVVFDDVDAELDADVLGRVVARLATSGQALLSSAHEEMLLPRLPGAAVWRIRDGVVTPALVEGERL